MKTPIDPTSVDVTMSVAADPTPAELHQRCLDIQATWDDRERIRRLWIRTTAFEHTGREAVTTQVVQLPPEVAAMVDG